LELLISFSFNQFMLLLLFPPLDQNFEAESLPQKSGGIGSENSIELRPKLTPSRTPDSPNAGAELRARHVAGGTRPATGELDETRHLLGLNTSV
jgi:hypothetical protein